MHEVFDYDDVHLELGNIAKDSRPLVGSISTPSGPYDSKSIVTLCDFDEEGKIAWEVWQTQPTLSQKAWFLHHKLSFPWHFFDVNDGSKLDLVMLQTMCYVIWHSVC